MADVAEFMTNTNEIKPELEVRFVKFRVVIYCINMCHHSPCALLISHNYFAEIEEETQLIILAFAITKRTQTAK